MNSIIDILESFATNFVIVYAILIVVVFVIAWASSRS